jgi:shikimate kinase
MLRRHLILVGLPGAGKSSVGRAAAERLGVSFEDLDLLIEARTGLSIPQLFAEQGEAYFRKQEYEVTRELLSSPPRVWAPGGGWVTVPGVLALVEARASIIHLSVSPAQALARLRTDATIRPLLGTNEPERVLDRLWRERSSAYATAHAVVDTDDTDFQTVVDRVCALALADHPTTDA